MWKRKGRDIIPIIKWRRFEGSSQINGITIGNPEGKQLYTIVVLPIPDDSCIPERMCRYADNVRHLTHHEILLAEKGGTEEYGLRVISPTWNRKAKGKGA